MRFSSSFKVGILAILAIVILLCTILWVKGRSFSSANRIEIQFKDVNGMRPGSGVQMMGLRVGQVEEITPVIEGEESFVRLKFVVTEKGITIPKASTISIQQSGLIGEQFLEITPPRTRTIYLPMLKGDVLYKNDPVQMKLSDEMHDVGIIRDIQVLPTKVIPLKSRDLVKTKYAYKIDYIVNLPGLILPEFMTGKIISENGIKKMRIKPLDDTAMTYPSQKSPYTIIEPMRISDFMDLQYKTAESLTETNKKINDLLSDDVISDLQKTASNVSALTAKATTTVGKAEALLDSSRGDIQTMMAMLNKVSDNFIELSDNINEIIGDEKFKKTLYSTSHSVDHLAQNLNKILDKTDSDKLANDIMQISANVNEISTFVNSMTKDNKLKKQLTDSLNKINTAMNDVSAAMDVINGMSSDDKHKLQAIVDDTLVTTENLKKFSTKLNKRFLLFRLMF